MKVFTFCSRAIIESQHKQNNIITNIYFSHFFSYLFNTSFFFILLKVSIDHAIFPFYQSHAFCMKITCLMSKVACEMQPILTTIHTMGQCSVVLHWV